VSVLAVRIANQKYQKNKEKRRKPASKKKPWKKITDYPRGWAPTLADSWPEAWEEGKKSKNKEKKRDRVPQTGSAGANAS